VDKPLKLRLSENGKTDVVALVIKNGKNALYCIGKNSPKNSAPFRGIVVRALDLRSTEFLSFVPSGTMMAISEPKVGDKSPGLGTIFPGNSTVDRLPLEREAG
jgi:hypothetical protein